MIDLFLRKASLPVFGLLLMLTGQLSAQTVRPVPSAPGSTAPGSTAPGTMPAGSTAPGDKVDLIHADSLNVLNQAGAVVYRLIHNVKLQQKGVVLYCDLAIQNKTTNVIEAYGNVRMVQGDTINVRGDTLYYYGNTRQANVLGHVVLKDRKMTLSTARLDYDMLTGVAHYPVKGRIVDRENILTSDEGYYDTRSKQFIFQRNVRLLNQPPGKEKTTILADSLLYNSLTKLADFQGPTRIISKDGVLVARNGRYNTITRVSNFRQRATAETDKYTLTGDTLNFDNVNEVGVAHGNVVIVNKTDKTTLTGDHGRYNGKAGVSRMIGHAVVRSPISQGPDLDTLFMRADTLFSFDNKLTKKKKIIGQRNVLVFKSDLQSKCDSLVYDVNDSLLYFYKKPIVWSQNYQMEADSMTARLKNNRISVMFLKTRAFVISQDTLRNYNQVKGRQITAFFRTILAPVPKAVRPTSALTASAVNRPALTPVVTTTAVAEKTTLDRVLVEGNGQTIYFAVDEKNRLVGMNRTECSKMNIEFTNSQVTRIRNYGRPDMFLTPPKELTDEKKQLDGFRWREKEKPTKAQTLGLTPLHEPKPTTPPTTVAMLGDKVRAGDTEAVKAVITSPASRSALVRSAQPVTDKLAAADTAELRQLAGSIATTDKTAAPIIPGFIPVKSAETVLKKAVSTLAKTTLSIPVAVKSAPVIPESVLTNPATLPATGMLPAVPMAAKITRTPLLNGVVSPLMVRPVTPLAVFKPPVLTAPTIAKPVTTTKPLPNPVQTDTNPSGSKESVKSVAVQPAVPADSMRSDQPIMTVPAPAPVISRALGRAVAGPEKKVVLVKPVGSSSSVVYTSVRSTIPARRAEKQKATNQMSPKSKLKADSVRTVKEQSDLELELNRRLKKH